MSLHEQAEYGERVREVEPMMSLPPLCCPQMEVLAAKPQLSSRLADLISAKPYSNVIYISPVVRRFKICVRGSRSSHHHPTCETNITLATSEGRLSIQ